MFTYSRKFKQKREIVKIKNNGEEEKEEKKWKRKSNGCWV